MLYDTTKVHPLDRYEYARASVATELAPVELRGRAPGRLLATMSVARHGDFAIEVGTWAADSELVVHRTERLIRSCDPECYRIFLSVNGGLRMRQAGHRVSFRARDIALYDLSRPWQSVHTTGPEPMRVIMLTFPRASMPVPRASVGPLAGALMPRDLPGRGLIAELLIGLADTATAVGQEGDPYFADVLSECAAGLIRQWLGQPGGFTQRTKRSAHLARIRCVIHGHLGDPALDPERIAAAANISPRYLHKLFEGAEFTPMQLVKRLRLEACRRSLLDPALAATPVKDIIAMHGYRRPDQFARDFKDLFGVPAILVRHKGHAPPSTSDGGAHCVGGVSFA